MVWGIRGGGGYEMAYSKSVVVMRMWVIVQSVWVETPELVE